MSDITVGYKITCSELGSITTIDPTWCIGNSLDYINSNFTILESNDRELCDSLSSTITAVESFRAIPFGAIMMWSGSIVDASNTPITPSSLTSGVTAYIQNNGQADLNWGICTGATYNGIPSPNLIGRFVVGAGTPPDTATFNDPTSTTYNIGDAGGEELHALSIAEIPPHTHAATGGGNFVSNAELIVRTQSYRPGDRSGTWPRNVTGVSLRTTTGTGAITVGQTGGGLAHQNRPPYYALYYIMRIK